MKEKISVIMAVYNTSEYLKNSIESILNQTYENIELIIIDDCSTDNSRDILNEYKNNSKIKLYFNKKNQGLSYCRNLGIKNATGKYLGFIDSDDDVDTNYYEKLINSIEKEKADIAICDFKVIYLDTNKEIIQQGCIGNVTSLNVINNGLAASCCNKLFRKELIEKYEFPIGKINEDIAVTIPCLANAKKLTYVSKCYYNYYQRKNSIQNSKFSKKRFDIIETVKLTKERINNKNIQNQIIEILTFHQIISLLYFVVPKEKNLFYRHKILKQFLTRTNNLKISNNITNKEFISNNGKLHRIYYKLFDYFMDHKMCFFTNMLILAYQILSFLRPNKNVIKENLTLDDLIKVAAAQKNMIDPNIKISVVIPNYNYESFLIQRLFSILNQDYKLYEILILDDCSKDNSRELIDEIISKLKPYLNIRKLYNEENSGTAFKQWKKGFENVTGDYVWIAEADDYCNKKLLSNLISPIKKNENIIISYADTAFIDTDGNIIVRSIKPEIDIQKTGHWNKNFINEGIDEINNYSFLNCTIANVSSCIIKNNNYNNLIEESLNYKQAGDWLFYLNLMKIGKISYIDKPLNYYRMHGDNVSSTMNQKKHLEEIKKIYKELDNSLKLTNEQKQKQDERISFLEKVWKLK